ncbi:MAG: hypothetical protein K5663_00570 [Clostridiales bacterium]|nr:hypothetical protein [Clostridiales bacterium]
MFTHRDLWLKGVEDAASDALRRQCLDLSSRFYGTMEGVAGGYTNPHYALYTARSFLLAYYCEGQQYYHDELMLKRAAPAISYALRLQHEDGTMDLLETNFHDGAETSFTVGTIGPIALLMQANTLKTPLENEVWALINQYLENCARGVVAGGFHTPNHRWVMSAALALLYRITGHAPCLEKLHKLLEEGIDCDEEGEFTERSSGTYNVICDRALIIMAEAGGMPELLDHVKRNLKMMTMYFEPDLTINTMNSTRQDAGTTPDWRIYYGLYLYMALKTRDAEFIWIANRMLEQSAGSLCWAASKAPREALPTFEYLPFVLLDTELDVSCMQTEGTPPCSDFVKHFEKSGVVRMRKGDTALTLIQGNPMFAKLKLLNHWVGLRFCGTFYAKGQFEAQSITEDGDAFILTYRCRWGYKGPLPEKPSTTVWREMDHSKRPDVFMQDYIIRIRVRFTGCGLEARIMTEGIEHVLCKLEMLLEPGGHYMTGDSEFRAREGDYMYQKCECAKYRYNDGRALLIRGGAFNEPYGEQMRGSVPVPDGVFGVCFTFETPIDHSFTLSFS